MAIVRTHGVSRSCRQRGAVVAWVLGADSPVLTLPGVDAFRDHPRLVTWFTINDVAITSSYVSRVGVWHLSDNLIARLIARRA